jgi:protein phosphatase
MSHAGLVRPNNEDHFYVIERRRGRIVLMTNVPEDCLYPDDDVGYLLAVADGIGGSAFGELASMLALRSAWEQTPSAMKWTWIITEAEVEDLKERISLLFRRMHERLLEQGRQDPAYEGMGTTVTGVYTVGFDAFIAHVGDSRAYLFHEGTLLPLTRDHTKAQAALDAGLPVGSQSWYHKLINCLGGKGEPVWVEFHHLRLAEGDQLMLCTDGLTDLVGEEEIAAVLSRGSGPEEKVQELVALALARGGNDNVTVIVGRYEMG